MMSFKAFNEMYVNDISKKKPFFSASDDKKAEELYGPESTISHIGWGKVTQKTHIGDKFNLHRFQLRSPLGFSKILLKTSTDKKKPNEHSVDSVRSTKTTRTRVADFYHHLIHRHGMTLVGINQSRGAQKVWHSLLQRPDIKMTYGKEKGRKKPLDKNMSLDDFKGLYSDLRSKLYAQKEGK